MPLSTRFPAGRGLPAAALAVALVVSACGGTSTESEAGNQSSTSQDEGVSLDSNDVVLTGALSTASSCDELLTQLKTEGAKRVGPYGFGQGGFRLFDRDMMAAEDSEGGAAPTTTAGDGASQQASAADESADKSFSDTNVQEEGVDEADRVKTDGKRIVTVANGYLNVFDLATNTLGTSIELPENSWEGELFLVGDTALVISTGWTEVALTETSRTSWYPGSPVTSIVEVDLTTGNKPRTLTFEGNYLASREIDGSVRITLTAPADRFNFLYPANEGGKEQAKAANKAAIENSTLEQWLPSYRLTEGETVIDEGLIVDCSRVYLPSTFSGFGSMVVLTADAKQGLVLTDAMGVFTDATTMYSSTDRMVVATPQAPEFDTETGELIPAQTFQTSLHSFNITDPTRTDYVASGTIPGTLLSQYSLSEYDGYLRVAATVGAPWDQGEQGRQSESFVTVLAEQGSSLEKVGELGGLGKGESIFAVRFTGQTAYVVTFEQIDPLYVIDLSDPTSPKAVGELKIPGFSSYLHPISEGRVLGIGTDGDEQGNTSGAVASLFDVSDPTNPVLINKLALGPEDLAADNLESYSEVAYDPRAFTLWDNTAFVPVNWWGWNEGQDTDLSGSAMQLIDVSTDTLTRIGSVSAPATERCESNEGYIEELEAQQAEGGEPDGSTIDSPRPPTEEYCWTEQPNLNRSVVVDDTFYAVAQQGILVTNLNDLTSSQWTAFPINE